MPICASDYQNIVVLTGAGVSVGSGLRPYRGEGGIWTENPEALKRATHEGLLSDPAAVWELFGPLREQSAACSPNAGHRALAEFEARAVDDFLLVTQNVDGLHQRAGSKNVLEMHGSLHRSRCSACAAPGEGMTCAACGQPMRPDIVLFGEQIPGEVEWAYKRALRTCDLFLAIGTSGTVHPASSFLRSARYAGARCILINKESTMQREFHEEYLGPAEELLPRLLG